MRVGNSCSGKVVRAVVIERRISNSSSEEFGVAFEERIVDLDWGYLVDDSKS